MHCNELALFDLQTHKLKRYRTANDLIQIMNIGNMLRSSLSQLTRPAFLMESELPTLLNTFDIDYRLEYSETCATVGHYCRAKMCAIEGHQNCTSLQGAFESLMPDNYTNFILTIGCTGVAIYCNDISFKIFDSHARDLCGRICYSVCIQVYNYT